MHMKAPKILENFNYSTLDKTCKQQIVDEFDIRADPVGTVDRVCLRERLRIRCASTMRARRNSHF